MKQVKNFLVETWKRLKGKTPSYFQVLNWISGACAFIAGFPLLVEQAGVKLPKDFEVLQSKTVAIAALVGLVVGKLTVQRAVLPSAKTKGIIEGATHDELPFTAKKEERQVTNQEEGK